MDKIFEPIKTEVTNRQTKLRSSDKIERELATDELVHKAKGIAKKLANSIGKRENLSFDSGTTHLTVFSADDKIWLVIKEGEQILMFTGWDIDELKKDGDL